MKRCPVQSPQPFFIDSENYVKAKSTYGLPKDIFSVISLFKLIFIRAYQDNFPSFQQGKTQLICTTQGDPDHLETILFSETVEPIAMR